MDKDYKIYSSEKEWEKDGSPKKSYYKVKNNFEIRCKCGNLSTIYEKYEFKYGVSHLIKCNKCNNKLELYGVDG